MASSRSYALSGSSNLAVTKRKGSTRSACPSGLCNQRQRIPSNVPLRIPIAIPHRPLGDKRIVPYFFNTVVLGGKEFVAGAGPGRSEHVGTRFAGAAETLKRSADGNPTTQGHSASHPAGAVDAGGRRIQRHEALMSRIP